MLGVNVCTENVPFPMRVVEYEEVLENNNPSLTKYTDESDYKSVRNMPGNGRME